MNHIGVFFNTEIEDSGTLAAIGDWGLTPVRYLFNGNKVLIEKDNSTIEVHHVESYYYKNNYSRSNRGLKSSNTDMLKCVGMIVCLIPGFFLSIFKAFAYVSADIRENHRSTVQHFTPIDITIGGVNRITDQEELTKKLRKEIKKPLHPLINTLTIHANEGILADRHGHIINLLNPKKVILDGAKTDINLETDTKILRFLKKSNWKVINYTTINDAPTTLGEAQEFTPPTKGWLTTDRWQVLIEIPKPAVAT